jgi:hypothetical protein
MLSEQEFMKGMGVLMSAYPDYECTSKTVDVYQERLSKRLTSREWETAVNRHIDTCKWFPKVSELLQAAKAGQPTAMDVWKRLLDAAEDGEKPEMDQATEKALAVIGGWEEFSRTSYDSLHYRFKEFKAAYLEARDRERIVPEIEGSGKELIQIEHQ